MVIANDRKVCSDPAYYEVLHMLIKNIITIFTSILVLVGCAAAPSIVNTEANSEFVNYKQSQDKALAYIIRKAGFPYKIKVYVDNNHVGTMGNDNAYLVVELDPGKHEIMTRAERQSRPVEFFVKAGDRVTLNFSEHASQETIDMKLNIFNVNDVSGLKLANFSRVINPVIALRKEKEMEEKIKQKNIAHLNKLVDGGNKEKITSFVNAYPDLVPYISNNTVRLLYAGPKDLRIDDVLSLLKRGYSEKILIAKINAVNEPYGQFTMEELKTLKKLKMSDDIIAAMMNVTTQLQKEREQKAREEELLKKYQESINRQHEMERERREEEIRRQQAAKKESDKSGALLAFALGAMHIDQADISSADKIKITGALAKDIMDDTGGTNLQAMNGQYKNDASGLANNEQQKKQNQPKVRKAQIDITCPSSKEPKYAPFEYYTEACLRAAEKFAPVMACNVVNEMERVQKNCVIACGNSLCQENVKRKSDKEKIQGGVEFRD